MVPRRPAASARSSCLRVSPPRVCSPRSEHRTARRSNASAHKKMSDELLAQYRRGAHIRTRSPWKDMDTAMGMPNTQKLSARRKAQHVRTAGGVLCKTFRLSEGCRRGVTIRTQGGVVEGRTQPDFDYASHRATEVAQGTYHVESHLDFIPVVELAPHRRWACWRAVLLLKPW